MTMMMMIINSSVISNRCQCLVLPTDSILLRIIVIVVVVSDLPP